MLAFFASLGNGPRVVLTLLVSGFLAACDVSLPTPSGGGVGPLGGSNRPAEVALLVPSGTGSAELDRIATDLENAARLAAADLNGVDVNFTVFSTQRNTAVAIEAARQAVASGADIILGPLDGEAAAAVGQVTTGSGTNVLTFSNNTAVAGGNVYLLGQTFQDSAQRLTRYAQSQGKSRVVVVHASNVAGEAGRAAVAQALSASGLSLAGTATYENSLTGVSRAITPIRSTVNSSGADALFLTSSTAGALPIFAELLPEAGLSPSSIQYLGLSRWDLDPRLFSMEGAQGGWFAMPDRARAQAFSARYQAAYGAPPHPLAFTAYDGVAVIGALWAQGGSDPLGNQALTRRSGFQGASGILRLRSDGTNERGLAIGSIQGGQVITLQAAPQGFGGTGF